MSNFPPYSFQPYMQHNGSYIATQAFQPRPDVQAVQPVQPPQNSAQGPQGQIVGISPASRPVTSREEAQAVGADFSGAMMLFPDITHNCVYIKRWDICAGGPIFDEYAPVVRPSPEPASSSTPTAEWASVQDMQALKDAIDKLQEEINRLKKSAGKAAVKNDADAK